MRKMSNGEVGVDLEHVFFMPMELLKVSIIKTFPKTNKKSGWLNNSELLSRKQIPKLHCEKC